MMQPPTKKTAPKKGSINFAQMRCTDDEGGTSRAVSMASRIVHRLHQREAGELPPKPPRRLVNVDQAAAYAQVGRTKMWELIHPEVNAVVNGHRPGSNRRWVDLDSIDELYRSPERQHEAEEKIRRLREKIAAKNEQENGCG